MEYPIRPEHIDVSKHFWDAFGHHETEISARWIVRHCQNNGSPVGWARFTLADLEEIHGPRFTFNRLLERKWIVKHGRHYEVTHKFIAACFLASPAAAWNV